MKMAPEGHLHAMRKSKVTDEQMAFALKQAKLGIGGQEVCRRTRFKWLSAA